MSAEAYAFAPEERPAMPGSPYTPALSTPRRIACFCVALLTGPASTFGNALVNTNVSSLAGEMGVFVVQASLLPAIYVAMNATANLTLVKARAQFGIPLVLNGLLIAYVLAGLLQVLAPVYASAVVIRGVDGLTAAVLITITVLYLMQALPGKLQPLALVIGISLPQLGTPLARLVPVDLLAEGGWRGLHLMELGVALTLLAALNLAPLPPTVKTKAFERLDLVTIALFVPAALLICAVLAEGRILWWTDTPWLGWALAAAAPLAVAGVLIEHRRARPLLDFRWLRGPDLVRFILVAAVVRLALAEQTYGAVGLLSAGGLTNDQLRMLFAIVALAMVAGAVLAVLTVSERRLPYQVIAACLAIALGAWMDSHASNLTRPPQLYLSQALIGAGTTLFIGPALVFGMLRVLRRGADVLVSVIVPFSVTQNVGGLTGSALLGTVQTISAHAHAAALSEHLSAADPQVVARLQGGAAALAGAIGDPAARSAGSAALLGDALNREATVLAFNDTFTLVVGIALATALFIAAVLLRRRWRTPSDPRP
ncbi:MAG: MFS transporter [Phenylobacterium sp.]|nr:MAG: MFS transporter [Phenylobacterium sp.]